jgi:hypothetical protein
MLSGRGKEAVNAGFRLSRTLLASGANSKMTDCDGQRRPVQKER